MMQLRSPTAGEPGRRPPSQAPRSEIAEALHISRKAFIGVAVFSFFINLLMLVSPIYMLQVYDRVLSSRSENTLVALTVLAIGLVLLMSLLDLLRTQVLVRIGVRFDDYLGERLFAAICRVTIRSPESGQVQALRDLDSVREFLTGQGLFAFFDAPWVPFFIGLVFLFHPLLGLVALVGALVLFCLALITEYATRHPLRNAGAMNIGAVRFADVTLRNAEALTAMGMLPQMLRRWRGSHGQVMALQATASDRAGVLSAFTKFWRIALQIAILGVGAYLVLLDEITAGVMVAASIVMGRGLAPVELAVGVWKQFVAVRSSYGRLTSLLAAVPPEPAKMPLPPPQGNIAVDRATVVPPGSKTPSLKAVSFSIGAGQLIGVVGPSAAGKSSLARLLVGVWPPYGGAVRLDGAELSSWTPEALGPHIGYLPQDIELFEGTVAENIARFGEIDPEAVIEAARCAGVHDLILQLPDGYDTSIGARGLTLSAGQRQRIALARALYRYPSLIVLDEPNSNLDSEGEAALAEALQRLRSHAVTAVIISHRPNILASVDRILVLRDGMVQQYGSRDEILAAIRRPQAVPSPPAATAIPAANAVGS